MVDSLPNYTDFRSARFGLRANTQTFTSPLDKSIQTLELSGMRWFASYELRLMNRASVETWLAFLVNLKGRAGRFYGVDPAGLIPRGAAEGSPKVYSGGQTGQRLITYGWNPARTDFETGLLLPGDYIAFDVPSGGRELHKIVQEPILDGYGFAWLHIVPPIRESPAADTEIITTNPSCVMALMDDEQSTWDEDVNNFYTLSFSAVEVFS